MGVLVASFAMYMLQIVNEAIVILVFYVASYVDADRDNAVISQEKLEQ